MTATAQTAHDKNGSALFTGDEGVLRFKIIDVREGSILTTSFEPPHREYWFHGSLIERTAQGAASKEADRAGAAAAAPAALAVSAPGPAENSVAPVATGTETTTAVDQITVDQVTPREQAIAHVMSKGRDRAAAE